MPVDNRRPRARSALDESIRNGTAVPILSDEAIFRLSLPGHLSLTKAYANHTGYEQDDKDDLARMARVYKLKRQREAMAPDDSRFSYDDLRIDFVYFIKDFIFDQAERDGVPRETLSDAEAHYNSATVSELARELGYPHLSDDPNNPLQALANMPFTMFLTTSPYTFLEEALIRAGKTPRTTMICWRQSLKKHELPADPVPPEREKQDFPLVCHLFGWDAYPTSLVMTEDDYLELIVHVNRHKDDHINDAVSAQVRTALQSNLLLLGFSLNSWAFRALYAGLIKPENVQRGDETRGIYVQLEPSEAEEAYLRDYLHRDARFAVKWQSLSDFVQALREL